MRILLDECVPRRLRRELSGHDVDTVAEMGWASLENGPLLEMASGKFDILLTTGCNQGKNLDARRRHTLILV